MGSGNLYQFMMDPIQSVFFVLQIRRSELIQDTLNQLAAQTQNYKKPLKVKFIGEQDAGGVRKEFFQLIVKQIFDINYFMFVQVNNSQYLWFEKCPLECGLNFELIGIILGLSIYNGINLDIQFPIVIYKKLMNKEVGIEDLFEIEPELCQNLNKLKQYSNQQLIELDQNFQIVFQDRFDQNHIIDLKENGEQIQVNQENLQEYIDLYVNWYLNKSIQPQFESFYKGFHKVLTGKVKAIFTPQEIQNLINGSQFLDFHELEKITQYEGYNKNSIQIKYFWEIIHEFNYEQQKKFLFFSTGSDRAPIKGLQSIQFIISKHGENNQSLPTAHTCFNHILLPPYDSKEKMKQKLLLSIENSEGFGLM